MPRRYCCFIGCDKDATWDAYDSPDPNTATDACDDHLGHLISDEHPPVRVYPIQQ